VGGKVGSSAEGARLVVFRGEHLGGGARLPLSTARRRRAGLKRMHAGYFRCSKNSTVRTVNVESERGRGACLVALVSRACVRSPCKAALSPRVCRALVPGPSRTRTV
jgi:hypothetical protein